MALKMLSLFSGIGGMDLAAQWAGIETVAFCEIEPFCQKVLRKNFGEDIIIYDDVRQLTADSLWQSGISPESISVVAGSLPCQPFSGASHGRGKGKADGRYLWPQMLRVIKECKPAWIVSENVTRMDGLALGDMLADLEALGYEVAVFEIPACAVGADHVRARLWLLGYADRYGQSSVSLNAETSRLPGDRSLAGSVGAAHGISDRMDSNRRRRLKALGNTIHPDVAYPIFEAIASWEHRVAL